VEDWEEFAKEQRVAGWLFVFLMLAGLVLLVVGILLLFVALLFSASTVAFWPALSGWFDLGWVRVAGALSFLSIGFALYYLKVAHPAYYAALQILFGLTLSWVALSNLDASHLTLVLALLGSAYAMTNGIWSIQQLRLPEPEAPQEIRFGRNQVHVYRGTERIGQLQPYSSKVVYQVHLNALTERIERLEGLAETRSSHGGHPE
jgi:hypothetical protein